MTSLAGILRDAGVACVLGPEDRGYSVAMAGLFAPAAASRRPGLIVQPAGSGDVAATIRVARDAGVAITVRGGGLSTVCAADGAILVDLSAKLRGVRTDANSVQVGGGVTMGDVNSMLCEVGQFLPVGVAEIPGLGLATQGGIGHFTRRFGLTLDHLVGVEMVTGSGEVMELSDGALGDAAELWWAVRGCAPNFGVVTSARFLTRSWPKRVYVNRSLLEVEAFPRYVDWATSLPNGVSASAVLAIPPKDREIRFLAYVVVIDEDEAWPERIRGAIQRIGRSLLWSQEQELDGPAFPEFNPPDLSWGTQSEKELPSVDGRLDTSQRAPFLKGFDGGVAAKIVEVMRQAPTRFCRQDFQHCGGAVAGVEPDATAFWCRDFDWSAPIIGAWRRGEVGDQSACDDWVQRIWDAFGDRIVGAYSTEIRPGLVHTSSEVRLAFGENLVRLERVKARFDPNRVFRKYYPIPLV